MHNLLAKIRTEAFHFLVVYYWLLALLVDFSPSVYSGTGIKYLLLVVPLLGFIGLNIHMLAPRNFRKSALLILLFAVVGATFSILKQDPSPVAGLLLWTLPIVVVLNGRYTINLRLLNVMFFVTILVGIGAYHLGVNEFGYLPGQASRNLQQGLWWRVSFFPFRTPPMTGMLGLIIIFANFHYNRNLLARMFFIGGGAYFLVLSGSRTALIIFGIAVIASWLVQRLKVKNLPTPLFVSVLPMVILFIIFAFPSMFLKLNINNSFLNSLLFRSADSVQSIEQLQATLNRQNIWAEYFQIFLEHPVNGGSSSDVQEIKQTETMAFQYLAQYGIGALFLFAFFLYTPAFLARSKLEYALAAAMMFITSMFVYSSFLHSTNIIYLLLVASFNGLDEIDIHARSEKGLDNLSAYG